MEMALNIILFAIMLIFDFVYIFTEELLFKIITSSLFISLGLINFTQCIKNKKDLKFPICMLTALIYAMIGDVLLEVNLDIGVIAFAVAQIFYCTSYSKLNTFVRRDFLYSFIISITTLISIVFILREVIFNDISMFILGSMYIIILSSMLGKSISNVIREHSSVNIVIVIGAILFFISDMCLILNMYVGLSFFRYICLITYYLAQFLLAFSLLKFSDLEENLYEI